MESIQIACAKLAGHRDAFVYKLAASITQADRQRDDEFVKLQARLSTASAEIKVLRAELKRKEAQIKAFQRDKFAPKSEKSRLENDNEINDETVADRTEEPDNRSPESALKSVSALTKPRGMLGKQKVYIPKHLRREVRVIEPNPEQFCSCGCATVRMGEQLLEKLAHKPAEIYVIEERYPKYTCRNCDRFVQAKVPDRILDYTKFDDSVVSGILVAKYADFLPLFRLEQIFGRSGLELNRSTLSRLVLKVGAMLQPIYMALLADLKSGSKLFADETRIPVLQPGLGRTKTCQAWAICRDDRRWRGNRPPAVAFHFALSREGRHAETVLVGFNGVLQVDGYAGYNRLAREDRPGGPLTLALCWAHARRKFEHVEKRLVPQGTLTLSRSIGTRMVSPVATGLAGPTDFDVSAAAVSVTR